LGRRSWCGRGLDHRDGPSDDRDRREHPVTP
jgi:hypothetical protein